MADRIGAAREGKVMAGVEEPVAIMEVDPQEEQVPRGWFMWNGPVHEENVVNR